MNTWNKNSIKNHVFEFDKLSEKQKLFLVELMNSSFPPQIYNEHVSRRNQALENNEQIKNKLNDHKQIFPSIINYTSLTEKPESLNSTAIMLTAGGEGERLRNSLSEKGIKSEDLKNFTKATFPVPDFYKDFGTLHINLALISHISSIYKTDIPVIITTGPPGSESCRIIPESIKKHGNFHIKNLFIVPQDSRLHLNNEGQIVYCIKNGKPCPVTNPDETGGPVMKLKTFQNKGNRLIDWLIEENREKILLLQATSVYTPDLIPALSTASFDYDVAGAGLTRKTFPPKDQLGTYVLLKKGRSKRLNIIEKNLRTDETLSIKHKKTGEYLPANTGIYSFNVTLLKSTDLPDYATSPKEILPGLPRAPKTGYSATDILPLSEKNVILKIPENSFSVIKTAEDLNSVSETAHNSGLKKICSKFT